ncbi:hypothetical protein TNCV_2605881 [Trichonephila clavipes]|nr:hypothetical protein TNCV_2605881 [Trichonephila clavipes]
MEINANLYSPERRLRRLVEMFRTDSSQTRACARIQQSPTYATADESGESISDNTAEELVHNDEDKHYDGTVQNNNHDWVDIGKMPPYFGFNQNPGLKIDDITVEKIITGFF